MTFPDVDVVIVAHDSGAMLEGAVASVEGQIAPGRIIVVDSGSSDGSVEAVVAAHPAVRVISVENRGFAAANNAGLAATGGEFVLLLNPDAALEERCVEPLVSRAKSNRTAGIVSPRITDPDGSTQIGSFGPFPTLGRALATRANRILHVLMRRKGDGRPEVHGTTPVDWVTGACMLVRRRAIEAVGPMDEGYFLYYEDVDWCHRMHDGGWSVLVEPSACCMHHRGGSGGGGSAAAQKAYRDSFYRYCTTYHLRLYALAARAGLVARRAAGGRG